MAKEFRLHQPFRYGAAVDSHELPSCPHAVTVNGPSYELLSCTALSNNKDIAFARRCMSHDPEHLMHLRAVSDNALEGVPRLYLCPERQVLSFKHLPLKRPSYRDPYFVRSKRLGDIIIYAFFYCINSRRDSAVGRYYDEYAISSNIPDILI